MVIGGALFFKILNIALSEFFCGHQLYIENMRMQHGDRWCSIFLKS